AASVAEERRDQCQRVGRLGGPEHFLALLAAALSGKGHAIDERRIHEQRLLAQHHVSAPPSPESLAVAAIRWTPPRPRAFATARPCSSGDRPERYRVRG